MEKDLLNSSISEYMLPKSVRIKPIIPSTPYNTPTSECSYMLENFERVCHCKEFIDEKTFTECEKVLEEIKQTCVQNKN